MKLAFRLNLKYLIVLVLGAALGMVTMKLMSWESIDEARMARVASRGVVPLPTGFFDVAPLATKDKSGPAPLKAGQVIVVEVLEALPGRPITGERLVRPDGTIGMGFYGDVPVAGLNRNQVKVRMIEHLRKYLNDEVLGLVAEQADGTIKLIPPVESDRIFVDEVVDYEPASSKGVRKATEALNGRIDELNAKLDRVLKELEELRQGRPAAETAPSDPARPAASPSTPPPAGSTPG